MQKLKKQYKNVIRRFLNGEEIRYDPNIRSWYIKSFSTVQEKSYYHLHRSEYKGCYLKLRAARGKLLADPWSDYSSTLSNSFKSWKHNSKRSHQYYR